MLAEGSLLGGDPPCPTDPLEPPDPAAGVKASSKMMLSRLPKNELVSPPPLLEDDDAAGRTGVAAGTGVATGADVTTGGADVSAVSTTDVAEVAGFCLFNEATKSLEQRKTSYLVGSYCSLKKVITISLEQLIRRNKKLISSNSISLSKFSIDLEFFTVLSLHHHAPTSLYKTGALENFKKILIICYLLK